MDFDVSDIALEGAEAAVPGEVPSKYVLCLPAIAGATIYGFLPELSAAIRGAVKDGGGLVLPALVVLLQLITILSPVIAARRGSGGFLGMRFKLGLFLWLAAYGLGLGFVVCWPWILPLLG